MKIQSAKTYKENFKKELTAWQYPLAHGLASGRVRGLRPEDDPYTSHRDDVEFLQQNLHVSATESIQSLLFSCLADITAK